MDTPNPTQCGLCNSGFNDDSRRPRCLPCSHNLCTECIEYLITKKNQHCPFCSNEFKSRSADDLMINRALLECINSLPALRRSYNRQPSKKSAAYQKRISDFKKDVRAANEVIASDLGELEKDLERLMRVEGEFRENFNRHKSDFNQEILGPIKGSLASMDGHFETSRTSSVRLLKLQQELKKREEKLDSAKRTLDSASTLEEMASLMDTAEEVNTSVSGWVESVRDDLLEEECQVHERKKALKASEKLQIGLKKVLTSKPKDETGFAVPITGASASKMDLSRQITALGLWEMRPPVKRLVERGRVFALQTEGGRRRSAKIALEDDTLVLYSLQDEERPIPKAYYVQYDDVRSLATPESTIFMDLNMKGTDLGRVHILLNEHGRYRALHHHFTGGTGGSYVNTPLQIANRGQLWERAVLGFQMPDAVSENLPRYSLVKSSVIQSDRGAVWYLDSGTPHIIGIHTGPSQPKSGTMFGNVVQGLGALSDAIYWCEDIKDIVISQCGLVMRIKEDATD
ncbi:uncharacterized protein [Palaemon carinicauda]|uniref:uncharacterized protein isoform X1 n=1 Tax=Palaemon carinicauda TaxID=392227 RepID=UPI0035B6076D